MVHARSHNLIALIASVVIAAGLTVAPAPSATAAMGPPAGNWGCPGWSSMGRLNPAASVMNDIVVVPGYKPVTVGHGNDIDWKADPFHNRSWALEFSALRWLSQLVEGYRTSHNQAYIDHAIGIVKDWVANNPRSSLAKDAVAATAHRVNTMLCMVDVIGRPQWLAHTLESDAAFLIGRFSGDFNHGLDEALALFGTGCELGRSDYRNIAYSRLQAMAPVIVDAQGVTNEQSLGYHAYVYSRLADAEPRLHDCGSTLPEPLATRYRLMPAFLAQATLPDATLAQFGDTQVAPASVLRGTEAEFPATKGASGTVPPTLAANFDAGFAFGRSSWVPDANTTWYGVRYGSQDDVHGHEDHTSILWWAHGRLLLTDTGNVGYEHSWRREASVIAEGHNVAVVRGLPFQRVATTLTRIVRRPNGDFMELRDHPYPAATRQRSVAVFNGFPALVVYDRVNTSSPESVAELWHLARGMQVQIVGRGVANASPARGDVTLHLIQVPLPGEPTPRGSTKLAIGEHDPPLGWVAPTQGTFRPAPVVTMARSSKHSHFLTVLVATRRGSYARVVLSPAAGGWYRLSITADGVTRTMRVSLGGYLSL